MAAGSAQKTKAKSCPFVHPSPGTRTRSRDAARAGYSRYSAEMTSQKPAKSWVVVHPRGRGARNARLPGCPPGTQHTRQASRCVVAGPLARTKVLAQPQPGDCLPSQFSANFLSLACLRERASERARQPGILPSLTYSAGCGGYLFCL